MNRIKTIAYQGDRQLVCLASHITTDGMQVYSPAEGKLGQYMRLVFELSNGQWIDVDALLISQTRHADHFLWGLSFLNLSAQVRQQLQALVEVVDDEEPTAQVRRKTPRRHTSRYRIARRFFKDEEARTPRIERLTPSDPATPDEERRPDPMRHVGYKTGTAPTIPERVADRVADRSGDRVAGPENECSDVPLPPPGIPGRPAVRATGAPTQKPPTGVLPPEQLDISNQLNRFEEDSTPLEEIYRRALEDLKRRRF